MKVIGAIMMMIGFALGAEGLLGFRLDTVVVAALVFGSGAAVLTSAKD